MKIIVVRPPWARFFLEAIFFEKYRVLQALISQKIFIINEIRKMYIIAEWYILFSAKVRSHCVKKEKILTTSFS